MLPAWTAAEWDRAPNYGLLLRIVLADGVADAFLRMRKFYRWVMTNYGDRPFFEADYDKVCEETSTTTEIIIGLLVDEFGKLVDCDSPEVIRKVVALDQGSCARTQNLVVGNQLEL